MSSFCTAKPTKLIKTGQLMHKHSEPLPAGFLQLREQSLALMPQGKCLWACMCAWDRINLIRFGVTKLSRKHLHCHLCSRLYDAKQTENMFRVSGSCTPQLMGMDVWAGEWSYSLAVTSKTNMDIAFSPRATNVSEAPLTWAVAAVELRAAEVL